MRVVMRKANAVGRTLKSQAAILGTAMGAFWGVFVVNTLLGGALNSLGVIPRTAVGLRGILFAPFLHANFNHLVANSIPFLVLVWLVMLRDSRHFLPVTLFAALGAGIFEEI